MYCSFGDALNSKSAESAGSVAKTLHVDSRSFWSTTRREKCWSPSYMSSPEPESMLGPDSFRYLNSPPMPPLPVLIQLGEDLEATKIHDFHYLEQVLRKHPLPQIEAREVEELAIHTRRESHTLSPAVSIPRQAHLRTGQTRLTNRPRPDLDQIDSFSRLRSSESMHAHHAQELSHEHLERFEERSATRLLSEVKQLQNSLKEHARTRKTKSLVNSERTEYSFPSISQRGRACSTQRTLCIMRFACN